MDSKKSLTERVVDSASLELLLKAEKECVDTCFARMDTQQNQCAIGKSGVCCRICHMGPCRITKKSPKGVCGADEDTIVARNYLIEVASGTAAHSDHGRHLVLRLKKVAEGKGNGYEIKDEQALRNAARLYKIDEEGKSKENIALELANLLINEFCKQEEYLETLKFAPQKRYGLWSGKDILPKGIDRMVVEALHRTNIGVDHSYKSLLLCAFKTALADGWGGSRVASIASDILFGSPKPVRSMANLGVLRSDEVNILVHGHEPELSEMLTIAAQSPEIKAYLKSTDAAGINLAGICCTANEILMRHGIPVAGNFLQQELAIITGAVEMMIIDVQCCMPSLPNVASNYHTEIVSTSDLAQTIGATHINFNDDKPLESAQRLLKQAINNYKNRDPLKVKIPSAKEPIIAGFSVETLKYMMGGTFRASFRPLNDAIIQGRIKGVAGIVGCNNPKQRMDEYTNILTKELIKQNVLILKTGCAAIASGKAGMLKPEIGLEMAGSGLREICETIGIPPILHMGSCVDNSRILEAATEVVLEGGLGDDLSQIPAVGVAPEWMSEKAVAIGCYFVASGIDVILGNPFNISGSENVTKFLHEESRELFGGSFHLCEDPYQAAEIVIRILDDKREKLGINKKAERKLYDMKDRRNLDV